jgi:hypothetical protein
LSPLPWGDLPVATFLPPILVLLGAAVILLRQRAVRRDPRFAAFRAGELARRLGLELTRGEPGCNLVLDANARGGTLDVKMEGHVDGIPLELSYYRRLEIVAQAPKERLREFDCRMVARARRAFPRFEVKDRRDPAAPVLPLEEATTGNPAIDDWCRVLTSDPAMARRLGETLGAFEVFRGVGLHLIGDGQSVACLMRDDGRPLHAEVLARSERMAKGLTSLARAVGG